MSNSANAEERRTEIALFRYTLILPLVREPSAQARQQMRQNLAAVVYDLPHSQRQRVSVTTCQFTGYNAPVSNSNSTPVNNGNSAPG